MVAGCVTVTVIHSFQTHQTSEAETWRRTNRYFSVWSAIWNTFVIFMCSYIYFSFSVKDNVNRRKCERNPSNDAFECQVLAYVNDTMVSAERLNVWCGNDIYFIAWYRKWLISSVNVTSVFPLTLPISIHSLWTSEPTPTLIPIPHNWRFHTFCVSFATPTWTCRRLKHF